MSAQNRGLHTLKVKFAVISGLVAVLFVSVVMLSQWLAIPDPSTQVADLPVVQILNDAQMKQITGGWLAPKARKARTGCLTCSKCAAGFGKCNGPDACSPAIDATTSEVYDQMNVLSGKGLSLDLNYSSDLADGTNTIQDTTLGAGWTHSFNSFLLQSGDAFLWNRGTSEIVRFTGGRDGVYTTSTGQFMTLTIDSGDADHPEIQLKDGTIYRFGKRDIPGQPLGIAYVLDLVTDTNQQAVEFEYDSNGLLGNVTDPFGHQMDFQYDSSGRMKRASTSGRQVQLEYNSQTGQLSRVVLPGGSSVQYQYNFRGQMTAKTVPGGQMYHVDYNSQGKAYRLRDNDTTIVEQSSSSGWATDHQKSLLTGQMYYVPGTVTVTDALGNQCQHRYDDRGNIIETQDACGNVTVVEYDNQTLLPIRITDANGNTVEYEYDSHGNRTLKRDLEGSETIYQYDNHSRLIRRIEPDNDTWEFVYDASGNLIQEIDPIIEQPVDSTIKYQYYPNGLVQNKTDRNGNIAQWQYNSDGMISKIIDPAGAQITYTYDVLGNQLTRTVHNDTDNQTVSYTYDARDRVLTQTDPLGHMTRYQYDANGNRTTVYLDWIDNSTYRSVTRYEYDARGRVVRTIEDHGGIDRTTEHQYDANDNRVRTIAASGVISDYEYDCLNRVVRTVLDPGGLDIQQLYQYDAVGNKISETNANGNTTSYVYDQLNRLLFMIDPLYNVTEYRYFAPGGGGGGCACGTPGSSLLKCVIDAEGRVTMYQYDALDRRIKEIRQVGTQDCDAPEDGDDAVTTFKYDANGNLLIQTNPNGDNTTYTYTARNSVETISNGCGETIAYLYDLAGNRKEEHLPNGNVINYEYDANSRLVRIYDTLGGLATYTYDGVGNNLSVADAIGPATQYTYDNLNRVITMSDPMGEQMYYQYDAVSNLIKTIDREDNQTVYEYDNIGRRIAMKVWPQSGGSPAITGYQYDVAGNLLQITDGNGNATTYVYDALNRLISKTYADDTQHRFTYDAVGNILSREDNMGQDNATGNIATSSYDDLNRLVRREYADGSADVFTYDKGGQLLSADNDHSHVGFVYDCADRILTSTQTDLPQTYSHTVSYAYDINAGSRTITYPSGKVVVETRDFRNRLADVSGAASYSYDGANRLLTKTFANGTEARYSYNDNDWVTGLRHVATDGTTTFAGFAHDYDHEGNRLNAQNLQQVIPYDDAKPVTHSEKYTYDDIYRLVDYKRGQWTGNDIPAPRRHRTWQLDDVHNWEQFTINDLDTSQNATYSSSINQMNEYDDPSTDGPAPVPDDDGLADDFMVQNGSLAADLDSDGQTNWADFAIFASHWLETNCQDSNWCDGADFDQSGSVDWADFAIFAGNWLVAESNSGSGLNRAHDKNGNLVDDDQREYYYDYQTTMTSSLRQENRLTMVKDKGTGDILGQYWYDALGRRIRKLAGGISTVYIYTGDWQAIEEYDNSTLARNYAYGIGIDEVLTMDNATTRVFYHANALGSVIALADDNGMVIERYQYEAYGKPSFFDASGAPIGQSAVQNSYQFTGRRFDPETGLYYYRTRYLDPQTGRFITRDTIGMWGDQENLGNAYAYGNSNPSTSVDALGTDTWVGVGTGANGYFGIVGFSEWSGFVKNTSTGQRCTITITCWKMGFGLGVSVGASNIAFGGPSSGKDLAGNSGSWGVEGAAGPLGGALFAGSKGGYAEGGVGKGLEVAVGYSECKTTVHSCTKVRYYLGGEDLWERWLRRERLRSAKIDKLRKKGLLIPAPSRSGTIAFGETTVDWSPLFGRSRISLLPSPRPVVMPPWRDHEASQPVIGPPEEYAPKGSPAARFRCCMDKCFAHLNPSYFAGAVPLSVWDKCKDDCNKSEHFGFAKLPD